MLAAFSRSLMLSGGRTLAVHPARQIVLSIVAWVTAGFNAPGVQAGSGRSYRPEPSAWQLAGGGCGCTSSLLAVEYASERNAWRVPLRRSWRARWSARSDADGCCEAGARLARDAGAGAVATGAVVKGRRDGVEVAIGWAPPHPAISRPAKPASQAIADRFCIERQPGYRHPPRGGVAQCNVS